MLGSCRQQFARTLNIPESVRLNKTVVSVSGPDIRDGVFIIMPKPPALRIALHSASKVHHMGGVKVRLLREYVFDSDGFSLFHSSVQDK